jgi:hypothetical protein
MPVMAGQSATKRRESWSIRLKAVRLSGENQAGIDSNKEMDMHGRILRLRGMALLAAVVALTTGIAPAMAGEAVGTIEFMQAGHGYTPDNVYVLVQINGQRSGAPSCAIDPRLAINPNTAAGKTILAMLLSAKASGATVRVYGNGS